MEHSLRHALGQAATFLEHQAESLAQNWACRTVQCNLEAASNRDLPMQDNAPWVLIKGSEEDKKKCGAVLNACAGLCVLLAALVEPFMPSVTCKVICAACECSYLILQFPTHLSIPGNSSVMKHKCYYHPKKLLMHPPWVTEPWMVSVACKLDPFAHIPSCHMAVHMCMSGHHHSTPV